MKYTLKIYNHYEELCAQFECDSPCLPNQEENLRWPKPSPDKQVSSEVILVEHVLSSDGSSHPHVHVGVLTHLKEDELLSALGLSKSSEPELTVAQLAGPLLTLLDHVTAPGDSVLDYASVANAMLELLPLRSALEKARQ